MLLGNADLVELPQTADFALRWLKYVKVDVTDRDPSFHCLQHQAAGQMAVSPEQRPKIEGCEWRHRSAGLQESRLRLGQIRHCLQGRHDDTPRLVPRIAGKAPSHHSGYLLEMEPERRCRHTGPYECGLGPCDAIDKQGRLIP